MKIGDKVKVIREYSSKKDMVGIIFSIRHEYMYVGFIESGDYDYFQEEYLELLEEAKYTPIAKFKKGNIVYYNVNGGLDESKFVPVVIVEERDEDLVYVIYISRDRNIRVYEDDLHSEVPLKGEN